MIAFLYRRLIQIGKVSGAIAFLFAAPYALEQYREARAAARIAQTLDMFKTYNAAPFTSYREKLTKALIKYEDEIYVAAKDENTFLDLQLRLLRQEDIETETLLLFDFFDGVAVCVTSSLCDNDTAIKLFQPRAADIYMNFYQYMAHQRGKSPTRRFGVGLEAIARSSLPE
jgi:hypothetical protein